MIVATAAMPEMTPKARTESTQFSGCSSASIWAGSSSCTGVSCAIHTPNQTVAKAAIQPAETRRTGSAKAPTAPLAVPTPLAGKLRELTPAELDTFQLVLDHGQLQRVLDNYPGTDLDAAQNIISLMKREFVVVP